MRITSRWLHARGVIGAFSFAAATACIDLPREDQVTDLRVLAISADPAEVLVSPLLVFAPPGTPTGPAVDVDLDIVVADPRGGDLKVSVLFCAEDSADEACDDVDGDVIDAIVADVVEGDRDAARLALQPPAQTVAVDDSTAAGLTRLHFDIALPQSLLRALLPKNAAGQPLLGITSARPRFVVTVENVDADGVNREVAIKRLPLTLNTGDPTLPAAAFAPLLEAFGTEACTPDQESAPFLAGTADCLRAPRQNTAPDVLGLVFGRDADVPDEGFFGDDDVDGDGNVDVPPAVGLASAIIIEAGETLQLDPVLARASFEPFQAFRFDVETSSQVLENRFEDFAIEWFSTAGDVGSATTSQQVGFTGTGSVRLGTSWASPSSREAGERDTVVGVVHDQRGGVELFSVDVEYR